MGYLVEVIGWMLSASNSRFFRAAASLWETKYRLDRGVLGAPKSCIFGSTETLLVTQVLGGTDILQCLPPIYCNFASDSNLLN